MNLKAAFSDIEHRAEIWSDPVGTGGFLTSFYTCGGPQPPRSQKGRNGNLGVPAMSLNKPVAGGSE